ncbi:hypothetical protein BsWGS_10827 [Bradybaena similaris]
MSGNGRVISKLKRRLLCLNRNLDERSSSDISKRSNKSSLNEASASFKFMKTELMSSVKKNVESSSSDCRKTKSKRGKSDTNSTGEATQKQPNCNVTENTNSQIFPNCPKDKTESNDHQTDHNHNGPSRTDQVNIIAHIEQLSIDLHSAVCDSNTVKLSDTRILCGGQEIVSCKELDCVGEPETLLCTQDLTLESTQNNSDQPEIQWDCQSPELVREVKQLQGQYGMEEIRKVVSSFSSANVELQKHIIPELKLHLPVKSDSVWTRKRKRRKTTVRAAIRLQQKFNGRESVEEILKWLQNKTTEQLPDRKEDCQSSCVANIKLPEEENESCDKYTDADVSKQSCSSEDRWSDEELFTGHSLLIKATQNPETHLSSLHNQVVAFTEQIFDQHNSFESFTEQQTSDSNISSSGSSSSSSISPNVLKVSSVLDLELSERDFSSLTLSTTTINTSVNNHNNLERLFSNKDHPNVGSTAVEFLVSNEDRAEYFRPLDTTVTNPHSKITSKSNGNSSADSVRPLNTTVTNSQSKICSRNNNGADSPECFRLLDTDVTNPHSKIFLKSQCVAAQKLHHTFKATHMGDVHKLRTLNNNSHSLNVPQAATCICQTSIQENNLFRESQHRIVGSNIFSNSNTNSTLGDVMISKKAPTHAENIDTTNKLLVKDVSCSPVKPIVTGGLYYGPLIYCKAKSSQKNTPMLVKSCCLPCKYGEDDDSCSRMGPHFMHPPEKVHILNLSSMHNHDFNVGIPDDGDFQMLRELHASLKSESNGVSTSAGGHLEKTAASGTLEPLQVCLYKTPSVSTKDDDWNVDIPDDGFQIPLEVDETFISQSSSIPTSAADVSTLIRTQVLDLCKEKTSTLGTYQIQALSVHDGAFEKLPGVDAVLEGPAGTDATSTCSHPKKAASVKSAMNSLYVQSAMTPCVSATEDDAMNVSVAGDHFHHVLQVDETSDKVSTSKSTIFMTQQVHSDIIPGVSATCNVFDDVSDGDFHMLQEDETFHSILTEETGLSEETAVNVATLNPLCVQLDTTSSILRIEDDDFDVSISDDDLLFEVCETLDRQADSILSAKTGLNENAAAVCSMALQEPSDMTQHLSKNQGTDCDVNFPDDDSQLLLEVDEVLDRQANILSTSAAVSLHEKIAAVETSLKTLQMHSDMIQSISTTQDEFANIPDDDFEQMQGVNEVLGNQTTTLSASVSPNLHHEIIAEDETLETPQIQSDLVHCVSMTQDEFANFPDDDFEKMLGVNEVLGNQTTTFSVTTFPNHHHEIIAEDETLETLQIQSDLVHCVSMTQDEFANFPDDDFEQMLGVNEVLGKQTTTFSVTTSPNHHHEIIAEDETLETSQIQSDLVHCVSMTQDEFANFPDDDFEQMLGVNEALGNQTTTLSVTTSPNHHHEIIAEDETLGTLQIQSDLVHCVSMTQDEFANFPDDDFEQMLGFNEALGNQTTTLSASISSNNPHEIIAEDETLGTLQIQSDLVHCVSMTQDEFANIPDDDFEQILDSQSSFLSTSTLTDHHEETACVETSLETLQIQSDLVHCVSMTQDEFANIPDDDFEQMLEADGILSSQSNILCTSAPGDIHEKTAQVGSSKMLQMQSDTTPSVSLTPHEDANFPEDDFEYLLRVNVTLDSLSTQAVVTHQPPSSLYNEITSKCKIFDTCQINRPCVPNNDYAIKKHLTVGETIHCHDGTIPTSMTAGPAVLIIPKSDHQKASLSETSHKTLQMQPSGNMTIRELTNITGGTNPDAFTSDSKQLSCPNLTEFLPSSSTVNNSPANADSPRRFRFKRINPLQMNSLPYVSLQSPFTPHFSDLSADVKCSTNKSLPSAQGIQVRCSLEEIQQKRQAALQKRSLRQSQLKDAIT